MSKMMLKAVNIKKNFDLDKTKLQILKGIDINIQVGEFVTIMGKSGSGKSTLLNILSTLDTPSEGEVYFEDVKIDNLNDDDSSKLRRESFGFVFQLPKMVKNLSILDNILLPSLQYKNDRKSATQTATNLMQKIGIENIADKKISQVSGGQLQRAGICRALINNPKILFADEPTGALDSGTTKDVLNLFSNFHKEGKTIVMVTHDINVAAASQRVLFMKDGLLIHDVSLGDDVNENLSKLKAVQY
ncbi:ABC transporter, ATP-binding protein [[Eubacterium] yurii subsp. margaretiae ATCC 43715]|nr:ABC transporter, ATP-binding protein [[Eubacterium] yurii subsp. margaretiae ATCC 43715]